MSTPFFYRWNFIALVVVAASLTGCGGRSTVESAIGPSNTTPNTPYPPYTPTTGSGSGSGGSGSSSGTEWDSAIKLSFSLNGVNSGNETYTTAPITTDNLLKVRVSALPGGNNVIPGQSTGYQANYYCAAFTVQTLGMAVDTNALSAYGNSVPGICDKGQSQVIDFSSRLSPGHGDIVLTVTRPRYDWYCMLWFDPYYRSLMGGTYAMFCPLRNVYQYHTIQGSIEVLTNGASSL
jgi:hypothetical protein